MINAFKYAQILEAHTEVAEKTEMYAPYNILPLYPDSSNQAIMRYPEVSYRGVNLNLFTYE